MKLEINIDNEIRDEIFLKLLKEDYDFILTNNPYHEEDIKSDKKRLKSLKILIKYYSTPEQWKQWKEAQNVSEKI